MSTAARPIRCLLVANRGEIALRIMHTAQRMGIRTIAVYSDPDAAALHVEAADVAFRIGGARPGESYLNAGAILDAARAGGADAIHPAYGFLAENADFAEACTAQGFTFVGPPAEAIRAMGDKARARRIMANAGVPVIPGYDGAEQDATTLLEAAREIGYPVLIKASAGGGGKGMRVVEKEADFDTALARAKREAVSAFGDDHVLLEAYLRHARHIEVQVFGDRAGHLVHLFERDCSVQRRYQKVVEEAPARGLDESLRAALRQAAIACARAVDYVGAGTLEFLVAAHHFYFMEMNTRLQVEHPVTEAITGVDLAEWQIRIAAGEDLPLGQEDIAANGHAVEVRLAAEDPRNDFLPQSGRIKHLRLPADIRGIRVDTGVREGDAVSVHYDPLIAKIIAHGRNRSEARHRLAAAIGATEIVGLSTNRDYLRKVVNHPAFVAGDVDTGFVARHHGELLADDGQPGERVIALAAFVALRAVEQEDADTIDPADRLSPWARTDGWRLGGRASARLPLVIGGEVVTLDVAYAEGGYKLRMPTGVVFVSGNMMTDGVISATIKTDTTEEMLRARAVIVGDQITLFVDGREYGFERIDLRRARSSREVERGRIISPMPGIVVSVTVSAGERVEKGAPLVVVEAMKMEHAIAAPRDGQIRAVNVRVGDHVAAGVELVEMEDAA